MDVFVGRRRYRTGVACSRPMAASACADLISCLTEQLTLNQSLAPEPKGYKVWKRSRPSAGLNPKSGMGAEPTVLSFLYTWPPHPQLPPEGDRERQP